MFRAAMEVGLSQRLLALLAALRRARLIPPPARWAGVLNRLGHAFDPFGSSLGGMVVRVAGVDRDGRSRRAAWHIAADHGHGPEIPCMPAILLARRLARGEAFPVGAFTAAGWLELYEFESEFARWGMVTDIDEEDDTDAA